MLDVFTRFCRFSKGVFCRKSPTSMGRNVRLKPGKLLNIIWHIGDNIRQFNIIALIFWEQDFFERRTFLLTQPVVSDIYNIRNIFVLGIFKLLYVSYGKKPLSSMVLCKRAAISNC